MLKLSDVKRWLNMKSEIRPAQITEILETIDSEYPSDLGASLKAYISELEAKQPERPVEIATIIENINSDHPEDIGPTLENYIRSLEAGQTSVTKSVKEIINVDANGLPVWSYQLLVEREQRRRRRAARRRSNYQSGKKAE